MNFDTHSPVATFLLCICAFLQQGAYTNAHAIPPPQQPPILEKLDENHFRLTWSGESRGRVFFIQTSTDLVNWAYFPVVDYATGSEISRDLPCNGSQLFIRLKYTSDAYPAGDDGDIDGDGLINLEEVSIFHTDPFLRDTDGDGFTDAEETAKGTNPSDAKSNLGSGKEMSLKTLSEEHNPLENLPPGWVNAGGFTFSAEGAQAAIPGLDRSIRSNRTYGADLMTHRYRFQFRHPANIAGFLTLPTEAGSVLAGSLITLNAANGELAIGSRYSGSNTPGTLETYATGINFLPGQTYQLDWVKIGRSFIITVTNPNGPERFSICRAATPIGFKNYQAGIWNYDQGAMHGSPGFCWLRGGDTGPLLVSFTTWLDVSPKGGVLIMGDSITEGFAVRDSERYGALLRNRIGENRVLNSGIGGAMSIGILQRLPSELNTLNPKWVVVYIGTNTDGDVAVNLPKIASAIKDAGAIPVICSVPTNATATAAVLDLPEDVVKVRFDLALTESGAGSPLVLKYYENVDADGNPYLDVHPNATGHIRMLDRLELDCPEMFR